MKGKKQILYFSVVLLALTAVLAVWAVGTGHRVTLEKVQRATAARTILMESLGGSVFTGEPPEYLAGRFISEDCKLQIRLHESAKGREQGIREALGEYADVAVFTYVPYTYSELQSRTADIEQRLRQEGYSVSNVWMEERTGNIRIGIQDKREASDVSKWIREQSAYPFEDVGVELIVTPYADRLCLSEPGAEALEAYLKEQGGYKAYKDYYCGYYISWDGLLHVVLKEGATGKEKAGLQSCLKPYAKAVVYEYGGYPEEEVRAYQMDLMKALNLDGLGLGITGGGVDGYHGQPVLSVIREDLPLVQALLENGKEYPFKSPYSVLLEPGNPIWITSG